MVHFEKVIVSVERIKLVTAMIQLYVPLSDAHRGMPR